MNDSPMSPLARLRAGLASMLAGLAGGARRLEHWSARGTRPIVLGLVAVALLAFGALAVVSGGHLFWGGPHRGPHPERAFAAPAPKPIGKPDGRFEGKPQGKPEAPRPPAPPAPPAGVAQPQ